MADPLRLVIGIPTYNRSAKLERVLKLFRAQIREAGLTEHVTLLVADNASTDATPEVCARAMAVDDGVRVLTLRRPKNLGFNGNVWALYQEFDGDQLWTFADDDLPAPNAVATVYAALRAHDPDFLAFSFTQPPGSTERTFTLADPVAVVTDRHDCAVYTCKCPKISAYVYARRPLSPASRALMDAQVQESGFAYVSLALSILEDSPKARMVVISEPQAVCDDDFAVMRISPDDWGRAWQMWEHPFVKRWAPEKAADAHKHSYYNQLVFLWNWRAGGISVEDEYLDAWWKSIRDMKPEWNWLLERPSNLVRFGILKTLPGRLPRALNRASAAVRSLRGR